MTEAAEEGEEDDDDDDERPSAGSYAGTAEGVAREEVVVVERSIRTQGPECKRAVGSHKLEGPATASEEYKSRPAVVKEAEALGPAAAASAAAAP